MKNLNWLPWLVFLKDSNALGNCQRKKLGISPFVRALEEMSVIFEIFCPRQNTDAVKTLFFPAFP